MRNGLQIHSNLYIRKFIIYVSEVVKRINWTGFLTRLMMMNCFCGMVDRRKSYLQPEPLSFQSWTTIANLRQAASTIYTRAEPEFRLWRMWMKLCRNDNHCTTAPLYLYHMYAKLIPLQLNLQFYVFICCEIIQMKRKIKSMSWFTEV